MTTTDRRANHHVVSEHRYGAIRHLTHRRQRAQRHQQVRRLLAPTPWKRRMEYVVVGFIAVTIGLVSGAAMLAAIWILWNIGGEVFRAALGGH